MENIIWYTTMILVCIAGIVAVFVSGNDCLLDATLPADPDDNETETLG